MNSFDAAFDVYREGMLLVQATLEFAKADDPIDWARDDLLWVLLDVKSAWQDRDVHRLDHHCREAAFVMFEIAKLLAEREGEE